MHKPININQSAPLLIEFLTEELPPKNLNTNIGKAFADALTLKLSAYLTQKSIVTYYVTPRRFACLLTNVINHQPQTSHKRKGPSISNGLNNGQPTKALLGFMQACNINEINELHQDNGYFYAHIVIPGYTLEDDLPSIITFSLKQLIIDKNMRWGNNEYHFVRPVRNILITYNNQVICKDIDIFGLKATNYTLGHRNMTNAKPIIINSAVNYNQILREQGLVIANWQERFNIIKQQLDELSLKLGLDVIENPELLAEVCSIVEYPIVLVGEFLEQFLDIPKECLILSMAKHQKYFATFDKQTKQLSNKFLFVANTKALDNQLIIHGNQKVLNARLKDAWFFFDVDKKQSLIDLNTKLKNIIYHRQLGSLWQRVKRIEGIASLIAPLYNLEPELAITTASLLKADITSEMVGEFPELQGIMGKYYALAAGYPPNIANAIEEHYLPKFSGDELPDSNGQKRLATLMALSDKLETITGIWGIGLAPTGEKDQYALRRAALGIVRVLMRDKLNINQLINISLSSFKEFQFSATIHQEIYQFIKTRLYNYLISEGYTTTHVQSVINLELDYFNYLPNLLENLAGFSNDIDNQQLIAANKRIENILKKNPVDNKLAIDSNLFNSHSEVQLFEHIQKVEKQISNSDIYNNWAYYFQLISSLTKPINDLFNNVLVMDPDKAVQTNRLQLLAKLYTILNQYVILSMLEG